MLTLVASRAALAAPDGDAVVREAAKHFQRGVTLYGEADYRSALVEFRRAATLAPNSAVLYNIAETEYQLHDYASALKTFERFLAAVGPSDAHRQEVENSVKVLQTRVGRLIITTIPSGADVTIDDQPVGKTPLPDPVIVNVGHLRVVASMDGRLPATRQVDLVAEEKVPVTLELAAPSPIKDAASPPVLIQTQTQAQPAPPLDRLTLRQVGWIATGVAAAGAITFGLIAVKKSDDLRTARQSYPTNGGRLDDLASQTRTFSIVADALAVTAVAVGALTLFYAPRAASGAGATRVSIGPASLEFETRW